MDLPNNYEMIKVLGEGTFGKCYLIEDKQTKRRCVLKQIDIKGMTEQEKQNTMKEARIMQALDHASIIKLIVTFKSRGGFLNIVMEYADGGDLSTEIKKMRSAGKNFSQQQILDWFTQMCLALKHVHERRIIHRDLKCQNIFLTKDKSIKLGDFGIAKTLKQSIQKLKSVVGTPYYMSPQICENKDYSFKTDIWSLGVVMYELCALKPPFEANALTALALKILSGKYSPIQSYSKELRAIIAEMLKVSPDERPNVSDLLKKPIIKRRIANYVNKVTTSANKNMTSEGQIAALSVSEIREQEFDDIRNMRNHSNNGGGLFSPHGIDQVILFPAQTPQAKQNGIFNVKLKQSNSSHKQNSQIAYQNFVSDPDKSKERKLRRREVSEPNLAPRIFPTDRTEKGKKHSQQSHSNISPALDKKKSREGEQHYVKAPRRKVEEGNRQQILTLIQEVKEERDNVKEQKHQVDNLDRELTSRYDAEFSGSYLRKFKLEELSQAINGQSEPNPQKQMEMKQSLYLIQQKYGDNEQQEVEFEYETQQDILKSMLETRIGKDKLQRLLSIMKNSTGLPTQKQLDFLEPTEKECVGLCSLYFYYL